MVTWKLHTIFLLKEDLLSRVNSLEMLTEPHVMLRIIYSIGAKQKLRFIDAES